MWISNPNDPGLETQTHDGEGGRSRVLDEGELPGGSIRRYSRQKDEKIVRILIGTSVMGQTAECNRIQFWGHRAVYLWTVGFTLYLFLRHPPTASHARQFDRGTPVVGFALSFVTSLPLFVAPPLILLALINALNRSYFRALLVQILSREDLRDPEGYYTPGPSQTHQEGFDPRDHPSIWVLEYDRRPLGVVAIDTARDDDGLGELAETNGRTVLIRHLATAPDFRPAGIDYDLLVHARSLVFAPGSGADQLAIRFSPTLDRHLLRLLTRLGFSRRSLSLRPQHQQSLFTNKTLLKLLGWSDPIQPWPMETWVLERKQLESNQLQS